MVLCLRFAGVAAVPARVPTCSVCEEMSANVVVLLVVPTRSVGEEMFANVAVFLILARVSTHSVGEGFND